MTTKLKKPADPAEESEAPTLRDQFAMAALPGILAMYRSDKMPKNAFELAALSAYCVADAMLEARADDKKLAARVIKLREAGSPPDG